MENYNLYILLIFIFLLVVAGIVVYFVFSGRDKVIYINQHENGGGSSRSSRLILQKSHLNKDLLLDGGKYNIYLEDNLKNENGTITIIHLDDVLDKLQIDYASNVYIVEYNSTDIEYPSGSYPINGEIHLHPKSTGNLQLNWHVTTIRINPKLTNVNINCMMADNISLS